MKITDGARELLESFLIEKGAVGIRLSSVSGCCGPQYTISLDLPQETDIVKTINGIQVAIDAKITKTDDLTLEKEDNGLVLLGASNCC